MTTKLDVRISRRSFLASANSAFAVALMAPRQLFAQNDGLVQTARRTAAASNVTVQKLRGNVSVLMGAGGNIAVLTGRDGKAADRCRLRRCASKDHLRTCINQFRPDQTLDQYALAL